MDCEQDHPEESAGPMALATFLVPACLLTELCVALRHKGSIQVPSLCQGWLATMEYTLLETLAWFLPLPKFKPNSHGSFLSPPLPSEHQELRCLLAVLHDLLA